MPMDDIQISLFPTALIYNKIHSSMDQANKKKCSTSSNLVKLIEFFFLKMLIVALRGLRGHQLTQRDRKRHHEPYSRFNFYSELFTANFEQNQVRTLWKGLAYVWKLHQKRCRCQKF